ncbi:MAG: hypothetical protein KY455_08895 [Euryarchaeota archaeon]|nr:hypothetical protein [Euryarchaeota archaeon]
MRGLALLVVCVLSLSGCVEDTSSKTPGGAPDEVVVTDPQTGERSVVRASPTAFADREPYLHETTEDGTFAAGEHWTGVGEGTARLGHDAGSMHMRDISGHVPKGVPVKVTASVAADLAEGDIDLWIQAPFDEVWSFDGEFPRGGTSSLTMTLVHTSEDPVWVVVFYDEPEPVEEFEYILTYTIESDPGLLLPGVPLSVEVPSGARSIEVTFDGVTGDAVWLWAPDDTLIGRFDNTEQVWNHTFEGGARRGAYVVMTPQGAPVANITVHTIEPLGAERRTAPLPLGILMQDIQQTSPVRFAAEEEGTLEETFERAPIQVGLQVQVATLTHGVEMRLDGPEGTLREWSFKDDLPWVAPAPDQSVGFTFMTEMGVEGLAAGTYTASFSGDPNSEGEMFLWHVYYAR